MGTIEKLFVQIFERKKWIVDEVKHRTLLFDQQLASKCLLKGIAPPPWLLSSVPSELNNEALISGLLFPRPPLAAPYSNNYYSIYNEPNVTADKGDILDSLFTEVRTSNEGFDAGDRLSVSPRLPGNDVGGASNGVQRPDSSAGISLLYQGIERLSDASPEPARPLENFQRSKSRQRALEFRNSAKSIKSNLHIENNAAVLDGGIAGSGIATLQHDHVQQLEFVESVDIGKESCQVEETKRGEFHGKDNETHLEELIPSRLPDLQPPISYSSSDCVPYSKPTLISQNEELPDASDVELHAWSKQLVTALGLSDLQQFPVNDPACDSNGVLKTTYGTTSPQDQRNCGISDIDPEPLQSLARVQRSKSRQRAIEVHNSAKAVKSCLSCGNDIHVYSRVVTGSGITPLQSEQIHESELVQIDDFANESCKVAGAKVDDFLSKGKSSNIYSGRITRSRSSVQQPSSTRQLSLAGSLAYTGTSSRYVNRVGCLESSKQQIEENSASSGGVFGSGMVVLSPQLKQSKVGGKLTDAVSASSSLSEEDVAQSNVNRLSVDKLDHVEQHMTEGSKSLTVGISSLQSERILVSELVRTTDFDNEVCDMDKAKVYDFLRKEKGSNIYSGRITRSRSSAQQPSSIRGSSHAGSLAYAGRFSRDDYNISCPESSEVKMEENSSSLVRGCGSNMVGSLPQLKQRKVGGNPTDAVVASQSLREDEVVQSNDNRSPVDKMGHVKQLVSEGSKSSPVGISSLQSHQILESKLVKTAKFDNEGCEVEGAKVCDFLSKEKRTNIYSGRITRSKSSLQQTSSMRESLKAGNCAYAGISSRDDNNICSPESSEQQIEENSAFLERGFGSGMVRSSPQLKQRKLGSKLTDAVSASPSLREEDVVTLNINRSPTDRMDHVEKRVTEGSKSSHVGTSSLQCEPVHELALIEPADTNYEICTVKEANIGDFKSKENGSNAYSCRIARSQISSQHTESKRDSLNICNSFYIGRFSGEDKNAGSSKSRQKSGKVSILSGKFVCNGAENSYPQNKRRKVEGQLNDSFSASPSIRDKLSSKERDSTERNTHFIFVQEESEVPLISSFINQATGDTEDCSNVEAGVVNTTNAILHPSKQCAMGGNEILWHLDGKVEPGNTEHLNFSERGVRELGGNVKSSQCLVGSPQRQLVDLIGVDQIMPEYEGFIMETDNEHSRIAGGGIRFDKLDLPKSTIERASVLEQLCKSACMHTPLSHFSTTYKLHQASNLYQSVPNGLLECIDLRSNPSINDDIIKQLKVSCSCFNEEVNQAIQGRSYSDCLPFCTSQPAWDIKKPFGSPAGKFRDSITSNSASSEKQDSLNPELPCISEENENTDEVVDTFQEGISSEVSSPVGELCDRTTSNSPSLEKRGSLNPELSFISEENQSTDQVARVSQNGIYSQALPSSVKREPLADITKNPNLPASVSEAGIFATRSSIESVKTEYSFTGTCNRAKQKLGPLNSNKKNHKRLAKVSHSTSLGENSVNMLHESVRNGLSNPKLSGNPSLRKGGPSFADRETKHTNIVSGVTSFIPLVKQKKAAAVNTGKRGVKVKALEAAEAAKRLAQEKENERMRKKEALKLERARLEQENLKQLELQNKKKEEERKKKEADMAERKRQREEEERKEKERKRKRVVEALKQQQENGKKLCVKKEKEVKCGAKDEQLNAMKVSKNETGRNNKREKELGDENLRKMLKTEPKVSVVSTSDPRETSIVLDICEASIDCGNNSKAMRHSNKAIGNFDVGTNQNQEQSYDISPYKGSDDEDEDEEDDIPNNKFVPSWASSRSALALVISSQQSVNPEVIFPPESFCSMSEVLVPRKQQLK